MCLFRNFRYARRRPSSSRSIRCSSSKVRGRSDDKLLFLDLLLLMFLIVHQKTSMDIELTRIEDDCSVVVVVVVEVVVLVLEKMCKNITFIPFILGY